MPSPPGALLSFGDKIAHFIEFFVLMSWFGGLYKGTGRALAFVGLALLGLGIEVVQGLGVFRTFDCGDIAANIAGLVAGLLALRTFLHDWCRRVEYVLA